jgi:dextranase
MRLVDLYPLKGKYRPGEEITLEALIDSSQDSEGDLELTVYHMASVVETHKFPVRLAKGNHFFPVSFPPPSHELQGYGIQANLITAEGENKGSTETAFDVQDSWLRYPRYGFLSDFYPDRSATSALKWLARFHVNGLQFYDWQYRHDQLLSPNDVYLDPLGRELSLHTVRALIAATHEHGIAAMAYLAVYAASLPFAESHHNWRLFDEGGAPCNFEGFLGLMNPDSNSPWVEHLLGECNRMITELPFDGLHVDQYGDPKVGFDVNGKPVDIPGAFQAFIAASKKRFPKTSLTFNAVGNWPIDVLTASPQDFIYIELWPETPTYQDVFDIVRGGREKSDGKPIVIAQYINVEWEANIRLCDALVFALGGGRIELGEEGRFLSDPYFPKHRAIPGELERVLRRYYDFAVRYGDLIGPAAQILDDLAVSLPRGVLSIARRNRGWIALHLINLSGLDKGSWCGEHPEPQVLRNFSFSLPENVRVRKAFFASPDNERIGLAPLELCRDGEIRITLPSLKYWIMVVLEAEEAIGAHDV